MGMDDRSFDLRTQLRRWQCSFYGGMTFSITLLPTALSSYSGSASTTPWPQNWIFSLPNVMTASLLQPSILPLLPSWLPVSMQLISSQPNHSGHAVLSVALGRSRSAKVCGFINDTSMVRY